MKVANEQRTYTTPLTKHALMLRRKIYQKQVLIAEEVLKVRQVEAPLSVIDSQFKVKT